MASTRRSRALPGVAVLLGLLVLASPCLGRDDDVEFALALADRGYDDLAEAEIARMPKGEQADYARCQMTRKVALNAAGNDKTPAPEVRAKFEATRKAFDVFLKSYPAAKLRAEAELAAANLMKDYAYFLTKNLEKFEVKDRNGVQEEASKIFDEAIRYLGSIKEREHAQDAEKPDTDDSKFEKRNLAWYHLCVAMHDRAMLKPPGDAVRVQQFTQAIEETKLFLEETDGTFFGFPASDRVGLAYWHRGQMQKGWSADDIKSAREYFSGALTAMDAPNIEQEAPVLVDVMFQAACNYGQMCNEVGNLEGVDYPKLFHAEVVKMAEKLPSIRTRPFGLQLLVEDARAMASTGTAEAAITQLNQVSNWAKDAPGWGPAVDQLAKKALNEVLAAIPPDSSIQLSPAVLFKAGEGSKRDQDWGRAIRAYQRVLVAIDAEPDEGKRRTLAEEYSCKCWAAINFCYARQERYLEAFFAADYPVQKFLSSGEKTPSKEVAAIALYRITALQELVKRAPKERRAEIEEQKKAAQELYTSRFQAYDSDGDTGNVTYTVAIQKLNQGAGLLQSGDEARGKALIGEAVELLKKIDAKDSMYTTAQARIGECLVTAGKADDAIKFLQAFIQKNTADWNNPSTPARQKQPWGWAVFQIANAFQDLKQYAKVVEALEGYEGKFQGAGIENSFPRVRYLRITALTRVNRGDDAVRECDQLMKDSPDSSYTVLAALATANDLKVRSDAAAREKNDKAATGLKRRSLPYYDYWISRSSDAGADQLTFVGSLHNEVESFARAAELWTKALEQFKRLDKDNMVDTLTINLAGLLVGQGRYAEALPQFEALFIKVPEVDDLRAVFVALQRRPVNIPAPVWDKKVKDVYERIADSLSKDADGASRAGEAKKVAGGADAEVLVRAYADTPEMRRALARATALTVFGNDAALPAELKGAAFRLVKRSPELLSNIARCYEELATANPENAIRAVNIYSTLIESSPDDDPENPPPGAKYSEKWFDWKYHWVKVYLATGTAYKDRGEAWLRTVCEIVRSMANVGEIARANKERADLGKKFEEMRDQADSALQLIKKEGCR